MVFPKPNKVWVVSPQHSVISLFRVMGYVPAAFSFEAKVAKGDWLVFTGGSDLNPSLYGEKCHIKTSFANMRDKYETAAFYSVPIDTPKIGICRGGQLLNVLSGGKLWQHCDGHFGNHIAYDIRTDKSFMVTSVHHQMMRPTKEAIILAEAHKAQYVEDDTKRHPQTASDTEACYYRSTNSFCYQPHPEYALPECQNWFAKTIEDIYINGVFAKAS